VVQRELRERAAIRQHDHGQVHRIADQVAHLEADVAGRDVGELDPVVRLARELGAMRAGVADEFDQLHLGLGIADAMAPSPFGDHGGQLRLVWPLASSATDQRGCLDDRPELHSCPVLFVPRLRASDSSTARSSGSPMSRKLSPSSSGIGLSDGGAVRVPQHAAA
jgi:hypothetical protein